MLKNQPLESSLTWMKFNNIHSHKMMSVGWVNPEGCGYRYWVWLEHCMYISFHFQYFTSYPLNAVQVSVLLMKKDLSNYQVLH